jgi:hypothetical protein
VGEQGWFNEGSEGTFDNLGRENVVSRDPPGTTPPVAAAASFSRDLNASMILTHTYTSHHHIIRVTSIINIIN